MNCYIPQSRSTVVTSGAWAKPASGPPRRRGERGRHQRREQNYFASHAQRLHYDAMAKRGWPIGSGAVKSACQQKQVRFKNCGQFWSAARLSRLNALIKARNLDHWDELWSAN